MLDIQANEAPDFAVKALRRPDRDVSSCDASVGAEAHTPIAWHNDCPIYCACMKSPGFISCAPGCSRMDSACDGCAGHHSGQAYPEIVEAHLPQCWVENVMTQTTQVLVIVTEAANTASTAKRVESEVSGILPKSSHLDIWWITLDHSMLAGVRNAGCKLFERDYMPFQTDRLSGCTK